MSENAVTKSFDPLAHRRGEPRLFIVFWTIYLLIASAISLGPLGFHGLAGTDSYRPNATLLLSLCGCGLGLLWPMVRLSQARPGRPFWAFAIDGIAIALPACVVVVSQSMPWMAAWNPYESALMIVSYITWAMFIVCALSLAMHSGTTIVGGQSWVFNATSVNALRSRGGWMTMIAVLVAVGPLCAGVMSSYTQSGWAVKVALLASPISAPYAATSREVSSMAQWGVYHPLEMVAASLPLLLIGLLGLGIGRSGVSNKTHSDGSL